MSWFEKVESTFENRSNWIKFANESLNQGLSKFKDFKASNATIFSPSQVGILTGIVIAIFVNWKANKQNFKRFDASSLARRLTCAAILPIFLAILAILALYRQFVCILLRVKFGRQFISILDASDAVWSVEHHNWRSIINIVALLEAPELDESSPEAKTDTILTLLRNKFGKLEFTHQKLFYSLNRQFGYSFWLKNPIEIKDYIKIVDIPSSSDCLTSEELQSWVGNVSNNALPDNHCKLWEILVSQKSVVDNETTKFPILCRVHHSLGDGVALLRFFLETITDQESSKALNNAPEENNLKSGKKIISDLVKWVKLISFLPFYISDQLSSRPDSNCLHGSTLTGQKTISWLHEPTNSNLLRNLRRVKRTIPNSRFSDLILTSISSSLHQYFEQSGKPIPKSIQIIVPARIEAIEKNLKLQNKFSVALQKLPILPPLDRDSDISELALKVSRVRKQTNLVRLKSDYLLNYAIMTVFGHFFPHWILTGILDSKLATIVFSNLPGPTEEAFLGNFRITSMSFAVPHRDLTGIGVTLLTYAGKLQISLSADAALLPTLNQAREILQNISNAIKHCAEVS
ncbi:uncharacterized protein LOC132266030 [Phlebotomus argentipes]|uniref:uncharacterized protein LOC132266030 n=1 Tax=Phlebotomus argentipes TaxID=94469 RepID=UPI0028936260|nr:uncharacterized protein LOC132266030 [Phlebotomus argentipes]